MKLTSEEAKQFLEEHRVPTPKLTNLLNETLEALKNANKTEADVMFVAHSVERGWCFWNDFKQTACDINYPKSIPPYIDKTLRICGAQWMLIRALTTGGVEGWRYVEFPRMQSRTRRDFFNDWQ